MLTVVSETGSCPFRLRGCACTRNTDAGPGTLELLGGTR